MFKRLLLAAPLILAALPAIAQAGEQPTERAQVERISKAFGLERLLKEAQIAQAAANREQMDDVVAELRKQGVPKEVMNEMGPLIDELLKKVSNAWDPKEASRIYAAGLTGILTEKELAETEQYYQSPTGNKAFNAISQANAKMQAYVNQQTNASMKVEMARILTMLKEIAEKKRAEKKSEPEPRKPGA